MATALAELNRGFALRGWPSIAMRIGLATGTVARTRLHAALGARVVLGDAVNVAARLEALDARLAPVPAAGSRILLDGATADWLDGTLAQASLGRLRLDGRAAEVEVHRLDPTP